MKDTIKELLNKVKEIDKRLDALENKPNPKATGEATREWLKNYKACSPTPHKHIINPTDWIKVAEPTKRTLEERLEKLGCGVNSKLDVSIGVEINSKGENRFNYGTLHFMYYQYTDDEIVNKVQKIIEILK